MTNHPSINFTANQKGSILIWSVLLGFVLTSVFFFFGLRQRANITVQRDSMAILNAKNYLESYADYLQAHPGSITDSPAGIQASLTQETEAIDGMADLDSGVTYHFGGTIFVEWNHCADTLKGDLMINDLLYPKTGGHCGSGDSSKTYDDAVGPISVPNPFTVQTRNSPFRYRVTPQNADTVLLDNQWHLTLETEADNGKKIKLNRNF